MFERSKNKFKTRGASDNRISGNGGAKRIRRIIFGVVIFLIIAGSLSAGGYYYYKYQEIRKNPQSVSADEVKAVTNEVSKLIALPNDEQPTIATVQDKEKLKDQPFFKDAQNGDKVLIYTTSKKAIVYRPSTKTLINVGPIAINDSEATKK